MRVVSNTSPISNLAIIGRLEFLRRRYGIVNIPAAVAIELAALSHPAGKQRIQAALTESWLVINEPPALPPLALAYSLDPGETAAIILARHINADILLMDERRGREAARQLGLLVAGVLGELIHAKHSGWLPNVRNEILRLRQEAGFFIHMEIEQFILSQVGE